MSFVRGTTRSGRKFRDMQEREAAVEDEVARLLREAERLRLERSFAPPRRSSSLRLSRSLTPSGPLGPLNILEPMPLMNDFINLERDVVPANYCCPKGTSKVRNNPSLCMKRTPRRARGPRKCPPGFVVDRRKKNRNASGCRPSPRNVKVAQRVKELVK